MGRYSGYRFWVAVVSEWFNLNFQSLLKESALTEPSLKNWSTIFCIPQLQQKFLQFSKRNPKYFACDDSVERNLFWNYIIIRSVEQEINISMYNAQKKHSNWNRTV